MTTVVRSEVIETGFGLYTDEDIKALSVCQITSPVSRDPFGNALQGGLYDIRMGATEQGITCPTCSTSYVKCPGHPGHVELDVPVYNPLLFASMYQLLRSKCLCCHKFRWSAVRVRQMLVKLKLLEIGDVGAAESIEDYNVVEAIFEQSEKTLQGDLEDKLRQYEALYETYSRNPKRKPVDNYAKSIQRTTIDTFLKSAIACKKCENCGAFSPAFRKDGYSKLFQKPLAKKYRKAMQAMKKRVHSALEEMAGEEDGLHAATADDSESDAAADIDSDDDDDEEEEEEEEEDDDDAPAAAGKAKKPNSAAAAAIVRNAKKSAAKKNSTTIEAGADKYLVPLEVEAHLKLLWRQQADVLGFIWSRSMAGGISDSNTVAAIEGYKLFFLRTILVPPNRFRPAAKVGDMVTDNPQNLHLTRIIETNEKIVRGKIERAQQGEGQGLGGGLAAAIARSSSSSSSSSLQRGGDDDGDDDQVLAAGGAAGGGKSDMSKMVSLWIELQNNVNCYIDSDKDPNPLGSNAAPNGIRQILEKKEGLFRRHMMGKRVNYCCRSVISPDPYLGTNEIGLPVHFAMTLHYPTPANEWNFKYLRKLVERGAHEYPGANSIEYPDGVQFRLDKATEAERKARANLLLSQPGTKVYRHLIDGDVLLVNRQPTLHKPGIMAHKARVYKHVREQTIRMNYANCNTYNADFDGDEMNCHFVQNDIARAEANFICNTDNQYIVPTSGNPLRGLIQDHVASAVKLTCKDTFLTKAEFQQLLYIAVCGLPGTEIVAHMETMQTPVPAILKPVPMWSGKQVISSLLAHMCRAPLPSLHLDGKSRTPATAFGIEQGEHIVIFRYGELLTGVLDKAAIGNSSLGIVHAVYELYGAELAGRLLSAFGRLFTYFLQDAGHSCGIEDLTLTDPVEVERHRLLMKVIHDADHGLEAFLQNSEGGSSSSSSAKASASAVSGSDPISAEQRLDCERKVQDLVLRSADKRETKVKIDSAMQGVINKSASDVIKACIPGGLERPFLKNNFSMMVLTGAKGSAVNQSQISCFLGQQALEGQRVPVMVSGKTLPSFRAYDASARAGGFVQDRFLTGVKPQEYYFHCMAGREGLVDTAVKTSRSGYLQRCLVKHLEELRVHYDMTVRDSGGRVIQFLYGEDGLDTVSANILGGKANQMLFLARNHQAMVYKYSLHNDFFSQGLDMDAALALRNRMTKALELVNATGAANAKSSSGNPIMDSAQLKTFMSNLHVGSVVLARRKWKSDIPWARGNILRNWFPAEIVKIRGGSNEQDSVVKKRKSGAGTLADFHDHALPTYDLKYIDGTVEKKVSLFIKLTPRKSKTGEPMAEGLHSLNPPKVYLFKAGLPDTAMSTLPLGNSIGACSEAVQNAIQAYVKANPDGVIGDSTTENSLAPEALELLVWVKYMRSLACPGEAVGCVAAQSVGEPSTQMTLNTFHLAGHGGANVTLGIPRLREIIMTASRVLKTPTMLVPLPSTHDMTAARALARKLSRLPLTNLLNHEGGVEVGERIASDRFTNEWKRFYRIRLHFQSPSKIKKAFGIDFETVAKTIRGGALLTKLSYLIRLEQRRSGERSTGLKQDALAQFRSAGSDKVKGGGSGGDDEDGDGHTDNDDEDAEERRSRGGSAGKKSKVAEVDSESDDEEDGDDDQDNEAEQGTLKLGSKKEIDGYDDDGESVDDGDDDEERAAAVADSGGFNKNSSKNAEQPQQNKSDGSDDDESTHSGDDSSSEDGSHKSSGADDDNDSDGGDAASSSSAAAAKTPSKTGAEKKGVTFGATPGKVAPSGSKSSRKQSDEAMRSQEILVNEKERWIEFQISFPTAARRLLMVQLVEKAAATTTVRATKDISNAYALQTDVGGKEFAAVQTEGVNFEAIWALPEELVQHREIKSNDIYRVLLTYGVEAARQSIVSEVLGVFGVYGIDVNPRHLSLIADFMTRTGSYLPMNRIGMNDCPSPFLQMSFETTCNFLTKTAIEGGRDVQESPSARIVLGSAAKVGTGCFDIMLPLEGSSSLC